MRGRALVRTILFGLLFILLVAAARASSMPLASVFVTASTPVWSGFQPSDWVTGTQVTCSVQADNQDGLIAMGTYRFSTDGGASWSGELNQGLTVVLDGSGTLATLTVADLALPESMTPEQNQIQFSIRDNLGFQWWSEAYSVRLDNTAPGSTVGSTGCYSSNWPGAITGTASDSGSGVSLVEIRLRRTSDGRYYSGYTWELTPVWLTAPGTDNWSYSITPRDDAYVVESRATDGVGHQQTPHGQGSFSYDATAPQSTVETTGCFRQDTWTDVIVGSANDAQSGVASVQISLQRASDSLYYNGSSWTATVTWLSVSGTTTWSRPFTPTVETAYTVRSRATDNCSNVQSALGEAVFAYDNAPPQSAVATSGCFKATDWPGVISGSASDAASGIEYVQITLHRASDGQYYDGSSWGMTAIWLSVSGTTAWSLPFIPSVESTYTVRSRATDSCGHMQSILGEASFTYDTTLPQSSVAVGGCFNAGSWPGAISGSASDELSGVASVHLTLRRTSDGLYYNGSSWSATATWSSVSGTAAWSLPFAPPLETTYHVRSRATDNCGNIQSVLDESSFTFDNTFPQSSVATGGYFNAASWPGAISGSASDALSGVASVHLTLRRASDALYYNGSSWTAVATWLSVSGTTAWSLPFAPTVETTCSLNSRATDNCGNVQSIYGTGTFTYDSTAPGGPFNLSVTPSGWTKINSFTLTWSNPPNVSGIVRAYYKWDDPPTSNDDQAPGSPVAGEGIQSISGLTVPTEGTHRLYLWLEDEAGNVNFQNHGVTEPEAFEWDTTPPVTSIEDISGSQGCAGWYTSAVQITFSAEDAASGISATFWRQDEGSWQQASGSSFMVSGEGSHTVEYYSVDLVGNSETPQVLSPQIRIDTIPPTTNLSNYTGTLGRNGWYISPVAVALSALDATSGVSVTYHQVNGGAFEAGEMFDVITDGVHTVRYYSVDTACNEEAVQTAATPVRIDTTPPSTSAQIDGPSEGGWFVASPVTVTLLASDLVNGAQTSGVDYVRYRIDSGSWQQPSGAVVTFTVSLPLGQRERVRTVQYYATDLAGNEEPLRMLPVAIDLQAPDPIRVVPIVSPPNWTRTNCFTLTWNANDNPNDLSGIGGAYYSFGEPSSPTDGTLVLEDNITSIPCVQVPEELGDGAHNVYVWLRDGAGNSDHQTRRLVTLRLDRTPPELEPAVTGNRCDTSEWYNSCVTVTFAATDMHSGMATGIISYQVNGGNWVEGSSYLECNDGVYRINCRAMDAAGNVSQVVTVPRIRLDRTAPAAPVDIQVDPADWSRENTFTISWLNPGDLSGLAGVFYKQGAPPVSPIDGVYVDGVRSSLPIIADTEGEMPVYVWLKDKACNSDHQNRATTMLQYDGTPTTTTITVSGVLGEDGWYTSAVQITLDGEDLASGWESSHYRIGTGPWQSGASFRIDVGCVVTFSYYSVDRVGNIEDVQTGSVRIDREPPTSHAYADSYSQTTSFVVYWDGSDDCSEIATFDVQYKVGAIGVWQDWVLGVDPSQTSKLFTGGVPGRTYYFRCRATDRAGNVEPYPDVADAYVSVEVLQNGDFEHMLGSEWEQRWIPGEPGQAGQCPPLRSIVPASGGGNTHAAVLGCPDEDGLEEGEVPFGTSRICQTLNMPRHEDWPAPVLTFRYHIITYDVLWSQRYGRFYDSFNVGVGPPGIEPTYVFTDGNKTQDYGTRRDLDWLEGAVDLRPYAGQAVRICLANVTRVDTLFNTWTFVDDVRLVNLEYNLYLPVVKRNASVSGLSVDVRPPTVHPAWRGGR